MKRLTILLFLLYTINTIAQQPVTHVEYGIDTDLGFGKNHKVAIAQVTGSGFNIDISGLSPGLHVLLLRPLDAGGVWGGTLSRPFYKLPQAYTLTGLTAIEYYFEGHAPIVKQISQGQNISGYTISDLDIAGLSDGMNVLNIRVKDGNGRWSQYTEKAIVKLSAPTSVPKVAKVEYFIDNLVPRGQGIAINNSSWPDATFEADISGISPGFHILYLRAMDSNGLWGIAARAPFYKMALPATKVDIKKMVYYFDSPASSKEVEFPDQAETAQVVIDVPLESLSEGFHKLYLKVYDVNGAVTHTLSKPFYKLPQPVPSSNIVKIQYRYGLVGQSPSWIDYTDFIEGDIKSQEVVISLDKEPVGDYFIQTRVIDASGISSVVQTNEFKICDNPPMPSFTYDKIDPFVTVTNTTPMDGITYWEWTASDPEGNQIFFGDSPTSEQIKFDQYTTALYNICFSATNECTTAKFCEEVQITKSFEPTADNASATMDEDETFAFTEDLFGYEDQDGQPFKFIIIKGIVKASGESVFAVDGVPLKIGNGIYDTIMVEDFPKWTYKPPLNVSGTDASLSFDFFVHDGALRSRTVYSFGLNVLPKNDLPTSAHVQKQINENQTFTFYPAYFQFNDVDGDAFNSISISAFSLPKGASLKLNNVDVSTSGQSILAGSLSQMRYVPPKDTYGDSAKLTFWFNVADATSSSVDSYRFDLVVDEYNDPPSTRDTTLTMQEDAVYNFSAADFPYSDPEGQPLAAITITDFSYPQGGSFLLNGVSVQQATRISVSDINKLEYTPPANMYGDAAKLVFNFFVFEEELGSAVGRKFTLNVDNVNDPPQYSVYNPEQTTMIFDKGVDVFSTYVFEGVSDIDLITGVLSGVVILSDPNGIIASANLSVAGSLSQLFVEFVKDGIGVANLSVKIQDPDGAEGTEHNITLKVMEFGADFEADRLRVCVGEEVQLTSSSREDIQHNWNFGESASTATFNGYSPPAISFNQSGEQNVSLTVISNTNSEVYDTKIVTITVDPSPIVSFSPEYSQYPIGDKVTFFNYSSGATSYLWDFGDGQQETKTTTDAIEHGFMGGGVDFTIELEALNERCSSKAINNVHFIDAQRPQILNVPSVVSTISLSQGQGKLTLEASDPDGIRLTAKMYYRGVSETVWQETQLGFATGATMADFSITEAMTDGLGLEYYFEVQNDSGLSIVSTPAKLFLDYDQGVELTGLSFGISQENYQIISVPLVLKDRSIEGVFDELGSVDEKKWRLLRYTPEQLQEYPVDVKNIDRGKGYWFISRDEFAINTGPGVAHVDKDPLVPVPITLNTNGWTQIGNPFPFDVSWGDVLDANNADRDYIRGPYIWSGGKWVLSEVLPKYRGAFVFSEASGLQLSIPVKKHVALKKNDRSVELSPLTSDSWHVPFTVSNGAAIYELGAFGMSPQANEGLDKFDEPLLPAFIKHLDADFYKPGAAYTHLAKDIVPTADSYVWKFQVRSNYNQPIATIAWGNDFFGNTDKQVLLYDLATEKVVDMKEVQEYRFAISHGKNDFQVYYGDNNFIKEQLKPQRLLLGDAYPNPFKHELTIPFTVPKGGMTIEITLLSASGSLLMKSTQEYQQDFHELRYTSSDISNLKAGLYMYRLRAIETGECITKKIILID